MYIIPEKHSSIKQPRNYFETKHDWNSILACEVCFVILITVSIIVI